MESMFLADVELITKILLIMYVLITLGLKPRENFLLNKENLWATWLQYNIPQTTNR